MWLRTQKCTRSASAQHCFVVVISPLQSSPLAFALRPQATRSISRTFEALDVLPERFSTAPAPPGSLHVPCVTGNRKSSEDKRISFEATEQLLENNAGGARANHEAAPNISPAISASQNGAGLEAEKPDTADPRLPDFVVHGAACHHDGLPSSRPRDSAVK